FRSGPGDNVFDLEIVFLGEHGAEVVPPVRVVMEVPEVSAQFLESERRRAERVLVRRQLDDAGKPVFTLHLLNRPARFIRLERGDVLGDKGHRKKIVKHTLKINRNWRSN